MIRTIQMLLPSLTAHWTATTKYCIACHSLAYKQPDALSETPLDSLLNKTREAVSHINRTSSAILCFYSFSASFSLLHTFFSSSLPTLPAMWFTDLLSIILCLSLRSPVSLAASGSGGFKTNGVAAHTSHFCTPRHNSLQGVVSVRPS